MLPDIIRAVDPNRVTSETLGDIAAALTPTQDATSRMAAWTKLLPLLDPGAVTPPLVGSLLQHLRFEVTGQDELLSRMAGAYREKGVGGLLSYLPKVMALPKMPSADDPIIGIRCPACSHTFIKRMSQLKRS